MLLFVGKRKCDYYQKLTCGMPATMPTRSCFLLAILGNDEPGDEAGTSNFQLVSNDTLFSVSCGGCSLATPAPTAATTAAPTLFIGGEDCGALTVSAPSAPHLEGCYFDTRLTESWFSEYYESEWPSFTQDGYLTSGQLWLSWLTYTTNEVSQIPTRETYLRWSLNVHVRRHQYFGRYFECLPGLSGLSLLSSR